MSAETEAASGDAGLREAASAELFDAHDYALARTLQPTLYWQVTQERISFDQIATARWLRVETEDEDDVRVSQVLEHLARRRFAQQHGHIETDYWIDEPFGGCALTGDGWVHSVLSTNDTELVLYEDGIHQLCRDAHRAFEKPGRAATAESGKHRRFSGRARSQKAQQDLDEIGQMLDSVLRRVIFTASVLADESASRNRKDDAVDAVRSEWKAVRTTVEGLIQRQARFEYFEGVGLGFLFLIPLLALLSWGADLANDQFEPPGADSFAAAMYGGAVGAVISVTQRMTANTLVIDFTAPKYQKVVLGALRPLVGAVFGAAVFFAFVSGFMAVDTAANDKTVSKALAFFALLGFAAGFSERFATDVLDRAGLTLLPTPSQPPTVPTPQELTPRPQLPTGSDDSAGGRPDATSERVSETHDRNAKRAQHPPSGS